MEIFASQFLAWYLSGENDILTLGLYVLSQLTDHGKVEVSVEKLFNSCEYIPGFLVEGKEDSHEDFIPEDLKLINDLEG